MPFRSDKRIQALRDGKNKLLYTSDESYHLYVFLFYANFLICLFHCVP